MTTTNKPKYKMAVKFNGKENVVKTDDLTQTFLDLRPLKLKTKVIVNIKEGKKETEKAFNPFQARRLWNSPMAAKVVFTRLILK